MIIIYGLYRRQTVLKYPLKLGLYLAIWILLLSIVSCVDDEEKINRSDLQSSTQSFNLKLMWEIEMPPEIKALPIFSQNHWFVYRYGDKFLAVDKSNGNVTWDLSLDDNSLFPYTTEYILDQDSLFVISGSSFKHIDIHTGKFIWEKQLPQEFALTPDSLVIDNVVVIGGMQEGSAGYVAGFDIETGDILWERETALDSYHDTFPCYFSAFPAFQDNHTACLSLNGTIYIINIIDGSLTESNLYIDAHHYKPITTKEVLVVAPRKGPSVKIYDVSSNKTISTYASCDDVRSAQPPVLFEDLLLIVSGCNDVYVIHLDKWNEEPSWVYKTDTDVYSSFVTSSGDIGYVLNAKGEILALSLVDGELLGKFITYRDIDVDPRYANELYFDHQGRLFALINGSALYAFKALDTK